MNRKMIAIKKSFLIALLVFTALISGVFATPFTIDDLNIQQDNGDYIVMVTVSNTAAGNVYDELVFTVEEFGTSKNIGDIKVLNNETKVFTYNLRELTDTYDLFKKGNTYQLTAKTNVVVAGSVASEKTESFLFGTERDTDVTDDEGLGLILEDVKVDGNTINDGDTLQVMNGETLKVDLRFTALENFDDARLKVEIDGYEHSTLIESTPIFKVIAGKTYVQGVSLDLPMDMNSEKDYKLRITGANDLSGITYKDYDLYVDTQRHRVDIIDLVTTPSSGVEPGQNIIANVRLKNRGQKSEDSVKVIVAIPDLKIEESSYVSNLNPGEVVTSDDMLLFVPDSAKAGQHEVVVTLSYDDGFTTSDEVFDMNILAPKTVEEKNLLVSFKDNIDLSAGQEGTFEVVVANPNQESKPISVVPVENAWADVEVSPSLIMVKGGESAVFTVKITPKSAVAGEKQMSLAVKEGSTAISEITVNSYVDGKQDINWVNVALAILLVIAIIILLSLVISIAKRRNDSEEDDMSTEEYY